jgi:hypothetical protein
VLTVACAHLDSCLPSEYGGFGENFPRTTAGPYQYATNASLRMTRRDFARTMRLAPVISLDFLRSDVRSRSDLHSPKDAWTYQTHASPGIRQDRCGTKAASPPFPPNGVSRLAATDGAVFRQQLEGVSWPRATFCIGIKIRARSMGRVTSRPRYSPRGAKVGLRGEFGGSWAARADGTAIWARDSRSEQLARRERVQASSPLALPFISWFASTESRSWFATSTKVSADSGRSPLKEGACSSPHVCVLTTLLLD